MSWFRRAGSSMLRHSVSLANTSSSSCPEERGTGIPSSRSLNRIDSRAALDSFKTHWIQVLDIMRRKVLPPGSSVPDPSSSVITGDDVTSILNHIDQMVTLLLQESNGMTCSEDRLLLPTNGGDHRPGDESLTSAQFMVSPLLGKGECVRRKESISVPRGSVVYAGFLAVVLSYRSGIKVYRVELQIPSPSHPPPSR